MRARTSKPSAETERMKKQERILQCRDLYRNPFFLWDVGWLGFWLVGSFLGIHFLISQILIGKFVMESAPLTVQDLVLLLEIVYPVYPV